MNYRNASVPAELTGEPSLESLVEEGPLTALNYTQQRFAWSGQLDAPERIAAGSTSNRNYDEVPASYNFVRGS